MNCDLCGKGSDLIKAEIEGSFLNVCGKCSKFGRIVEENSFMKSVYEKEKTVFLNKQKDKKVEKKEREFVDTVVSDYFARIRKARESLRLTQKELGEKIAEKESIIHKIESGLMEPNLKLAKKLESFFKIKLIEIYEEGKIKKIDFKSDKLTIGDLVDMKK